MAPEAFHGLAGDIVGAIEPHTEADPVALLLHHLAFFGNAIGRGPYYLADGVRHSANLYVGFVGESSKARKGTAAERIRKIFEIADAEWVSGRIKSGMASGEGLIAEVRDAAFEEGDDGSELIGAGVVDKRLMIVESEFVGALTVMRRPGNILSRVVRDAWDGKPLETLTKNRPMRASDSHVSIIGHITIDELLAKLDETSMANGFANRFLFACVRRVRLLAHGGDLPDDVVQELAARTRQAISKAKNVARVTMTSAAAAAWTCAYPNLSAAHPGLLGAILGRAEAQTIRLALIYALLDEKEHIGIEHLNAALAVWSYCEVSARCIFRDIAGDPADVICAALRSAGATGMTRTAIRDLFGRHRKGHEIEDALARLTMSGKARVNREDTGGRPREVWKALVPVTVLLTLKGASTVERRPDPGKPGAT